MKVSLSLVPREVLKVLEHLIKHGHESYIAGGAVRDILLSRNPRDWDIASAATPDQVEALFDGALPTGKRFGTMTVREGNFMIEVTTFRTESGYSDGRRPDQVKFSLSAEEDAKRRDFTINGMFLSLDGTLIDYVGGRDDIVRKTIRAIGNPTERFKEDKIRPLRGIRFATTLDFNFDPSIASAILARSEYVMDCDESIVQYEFNKILLDDNVAIGLHYMYDCDLLHFLMPEVAAMFNYNQENYHHSRSLWGHTMTAVELVPKILELRLAALFHDTGKPRTRTTGIDGVGHYYGHHKVSAKIARERLTTLRYPNKVVEDVSALIYDHMSIRHEPTKKSVKKILIRVGEDNMENLLDLFVADTCSSAPPFRDELEKIVLFQSILKEVLSNKEPFKVSHLAIGGQDLIEIGLEPSPVIGEVLKSLLSMAIKDPNLNNKEDLIRIARDILKDNFNISL